MLVVVVVPPPSIRLLLGTPRSTRRLDRRSKLMERVLLLFFPRVSVAVVVEKAWTPPPRDDRTSIKGRPSTITRAAIIVVKSGGKKQNARAIACFCCETEDLLASL